MMQNEGSEACPAPVRRTVRGEHSDEYRLGVALRSHNAAQGGRRGARHVIRTCPTTVVWGHVPADRDSVVDVNVGDVVQVETLSHQGLVNGAPPVEFLASLGVSPQEILPEITAIHHEVARPDGASSHLLTGPIEVIGAAAGDSLEVHILEAELRVGYGINVAGPDRGLLPDLLEGPSLRILRSGPDDRMDFGGGVTVPVAPFPGFVGLAPKPTDGLLSARTPGSWGGNLDLRVLTPGSSIVLPVARPGAQLYLGDPHSAQGDGEVNGTAVEHSATFVITTTLHQDLRVQSPVAITPTHVLTTGIASDPKEALRSALRNAIELIGGWTDGRLDTADAYALCSIAADVGLAEVVNGADVAYVSIPRDVLPSAR